MFCFTSHIGTHSKLFEPYSQCLVGAINGGREIKCQSYQSFFRYYERVEVKFIYRLGMPAVSIFLIFSLSYAINNLGNLFAEAQSSVTTIQDEQNANEAIQTFQIDGAVGSLVTDLLNPTMRENVSDSVPPL